MYRSRSRYAFGNKKRNRSYFSSSRSSGAVRPYPRYRPPLRIGYTSPNAYYKESMPTSMKVCLKYTGHYSLQPTTGLAADQIFRLNSIFDPDLTNVGHQPQAHDQWGLLYGRYRVDKVMVTVIPATVAGGGGGGFFTIHGSTSATAITDPVVASESPGAKTSCINTDTHNPPIIKFFNLPDLLGQTYTQYNSDDLNSAPFGGQPTPALVCHVTYVDSGVTNSTALFQVNLRYYVTLLAPLQLAQS